MSSRRNICSGGPFEDVVGYSHAVRVGPWVLVSGTTSMTAQGLVGEGDVYAQSVQALKTIEAALREAGAQLSDVVRTRMYVTRIAHWEEVARAHAEYFRSVKPAATMVEVQKLIDPRMLIEIEADACILQAAEGGPAGA